MSARVAFARGLLEHPSNLPQLPFAWLEAPRAAELRWTREVPDWHRPDRWPQGRLFGPPGEYRWQCRGGKIHAVLLLEEGEAFPEGFEAPLRLEAAPKADAADGELLLWGEWVDPGQDSRSNPEGGPLFYTPSLPSVQTYPLDPGLSMAPPATPRLVVRRYRQQDAPEEHFERCVAVRLHPGKEAEDA